ncbi:SRPBCC domain-containing protein [Acidaminobacter sp. JC074]|uniref:SRPBCC family protein n=1 Tax=Acidaminobacter sp. JC074 TaxID=2530199 RepID=UPI001F0FD86F|nr:SRPBCC domain-containing protein [Acidaminobacter sp. JC074]MCH4886165.1 SRPBCC domain-containing protein [Acidaminobacter sp. JC074]
MLEIQVNLPIKKEDAIRYFIEPELLKRWLCRDAIVNPVKGGAYELFWELEDRNHNCTQGCHLTSLTEDYISFTWKGPIEFEDIMNQEPLTHVVIMFHEKNNSTQVTLLHSGWQSSEKWQRARLYFKNAWGSALKSLRNMEFL